MSKFLSLLVLRDSFIFNGTIKELNEKLYLDNGRRFRIEWTGYNSFKFFAKLSLGTLIVSGMPSAAEGIKGFAELKEVENNTTQIHLKTKVRIELYFFLSIFIVFYIIGLASEGKIPDWFPLILPCGLLWFWFVYRIQENILFASLKNYLIKN